MVMKNLGADPWEKSIAVRNELEQIRRCVDGLVTSTVALENAIYSFLEGETGDIIRAMQWIESGDKVRRKTWGGMPDAFLGLGKVHPCDDDTVFMFRNHIAGEPWNPSPYEILATDYVRCGRVKHD